MCVVIVAVVANDFVVANIAFNCVLFLLLLLLISIIVCFCCCFVVATNFDIRVVFVVVFVADAFVVCFVLLYCVFVFKS